MLAVTVPTTVKMDNWEGVEKDDGSGERMTEVGKDDGGGERVIKVGKGGDGDRSSVITCIIPNVPNSLRSAGERAPRGFIILI